MSSSSPVAPPVALTIAGSDSGAGAGIQADLLTFAAHGVFGTTAITCLTAQNPQGVSAIEVMPQSFVSAQLDKVAEFFQFDAIKTGMLFNSGIISAVARFVESMPRVPLVVDPVMVATSGAVLLENEAINALSSELLPLASLITPNLDEAAVLLGSKPDCEDSMQEGARELANQYKTAVLLKGGHLINGAQLVDVLVEADGAVHLFHSLRIDNVDTHGSGCTLASAIAARLACGSDLKTAVSEALAYLRRAMQKPLLLNGRAFIRH